MGRIWIGSPKRVVGRMGGKGVFPSFKNQVGVFLYAASVRFRNSREELCLKISSFGRVNRRARAPRAHGSSELSKTRDALAKGSSGWGALLCSLKLLPASSRNSLVLFFLQKFPHPDGSWGGWGPLMRIPSPQLPVGPGGVHVRVQGSG